MTENTTEIDYTVIDACVNNIQKLIDDTYISVELTNLKNVFEYSQSDYVNILQQLTCTLETINQTVTELLLTSKNMLLTAKQIYKDTDETLAANVITH